MAVCKCNCDGRGHKCRRAHTRRYESLFHSYLEYFGSIAAEFERKVVGCCRIIADARYGGTAFLGKLPKG